MIAARDELDINTKKLPLDSYSVVCAKISTAAMFGDFDAATSVSVNLRNAGLDQTRTALVRRRPISIVPKTVRPQNHESLAAFFSSIRLRSSGVNCSTVAIAPSMRSRMVASAVK